MEVKLKILQATCTTCRVRRLNTRMRILRFARATFEVLLGVKVQMSCTYHINERFSTTSPTHREYRLLPGPQHVRLDLQVELAILENTFDTQALARSSSTPRDEL